LGSTSGVFSGSPTSTTASTSTTSPGTTGLSNYSQDLQNEVTREVSLAELPMQELQGEVSTLTGQSTELATLSSDFQSLQSSIATLNTDSQGILAASVSNADVLSATAGAGALAGSYTVTVTQPGTYASAMSTSGVSDPTSDNISSASSFTLSVGGVETTITPSSNTLDALVSAINASSAGVQATVVNVGSSSSPNYELTLQNTLFGDSPISLTATGSNTNLLTPLTTGQDVKYQVNGLPATPISSTSSTVTLSTGLTVNLLGTGTSTVTVAPSTTSLSNDLESFVTAFNNVSNELTNNTGQNTGALNGDSIIDTLEQALNSIGNYTSTSNGVTSLSALGVTFNKTGQLQFDPSVLADASSSQVNDVVSFLGGATSGGFLQFATNTLTDIEDPTTGILPNDITQTTNSITSDNQLISQQQTQITQLQTNLQSQMSTADAAIAELESQQSFYSSLFTSMLIPSPEELSQL
jgi:flagellar hook-associated protein 2